MSIRSILWAFDQDIMSSSHKFVLVALSNFASDTGVTYPSIPTIATMTRQNEKTVRQALAKLVEDGVIEDTGKRTGATGRVVVYRLPEAAYMAGKQEAILPKTGVLNPPKNGSIKSSQKREDCKVQSGCNPPKNGRTCIIGEQGTGKGRGETAAALAAAEPVPKIRQLTDAWLEAWKTVFKTQYVFNKSKDGPAAARLAKLEDTAGDLVAVARRAWARPDRFWCKQASSIAGFASAINQIRAELHDPGRSSIAPSQTPGRHDPNSNL